MIAASPSASPTLAKHSKENETKLKGFATCLILLSGGRRPLEQHLAYGFLSLCDRDLSSNGLLKIVLYISWDEGVQFMRFPPPASWTIWTIRWPMTSPIRDYGWCQKSGGRRDQLHQLRGHGGGRRGWVQRGKPCSWRNAAEVVGNVHGDTQYRQSCG